MYQVKIVFTINDCLNKINADSNTNAKKSAGELCQGKADKYAIKCQCLLNKLSCDVESQGDQHITWDQVKNGRLDCGNAADESLRCSVIGEDRESPCFKRIFKCEDFRSMTSLQLAHRRDHRVKCRKVLDYSGLHGRSEHLPMSVTVYHICVISYCSDSCRCCSRDAEQDLEFFQCADGSYRSLASVGNNIASCKDGSDELVDVPGFKCHLPYHLNAKKVVVPQSNLYDSHSFCQGEKDLCFSDSGELHALKCFRCLDKKLLVSAEQVCDGVIDCYDLSDERFCPNSPLNMKLERMMGKCEEAGNVVCEGHGCIPVTAALCDPSFTCENQINTKYCGQPQISNSQISCVSKGSSHLVVAAKCDGRPECDSFEDECHEDCPFVPNYCNCDGANCTKPYCSASGQNEIESDCPARFYCDVTIGQSSIDVRQLCDGVVDCRDKSDESMEMCHDKLFFCLDGKSSVLMSQVGDGVLDCDDGSDENDIRFSDRNNLIASPILRFAYWVMGILCLVGNLIVLIDTVINMRQSCDESIVVRAHRLFIINLSFSDILMGVYLISVSIKGLYSQGFFTECQYEWRSSVKCTVVGTLAWTSLQSSANTLALITFYRLIGIYRPFLVSKVRILTLGLIIAASWFICLTISLVPSSPCFWSYFTSSFWYPNFFTRSSKFSKNLMLDIGSKILMKPDVELVEAVETVKNAFSDTEVKGRIGYFGGTCVCLPHVFVGHTDTSSGYTLFVITYNVLLFVFIGLGYFVITRLAKEVQSVNNEEVCSLQNRIIKLVSVDFMTRVPLCVLFYLSYNGVQINRTIYIIFAGFLIPINAVCNPILYTNCFRNAYESLLTNSSLRSMSVFTRGSSSNLDTSTPSKIAVRTSDIKHIT